MQTVVKPSEDLAYWIGALQADGCFRKYYRKHKGRFEYRLAMDVATKSLPMLEKVAKLSFQIFGRTSKIYKRSKGDMWDYLTVVKRLLPLFEHLDIRFGDPPKPPKWVLGKSEFFGAYLAGVIDGDGDVRIKRPKYPQCVIRITSGHEQIELKKSILTILGCSVSLTKCQREVLLKDRLISGKWVALEFLVSKKTKDFIKKYLLQYMVLDYKRQKILSYLKKFEN